MGGIYLVREVEGLVEMREQPYSAEEILQRLLVDYPSLLAGDQIDNASPRRWLLVSREAAVPAEEGGAGRWSLDHLFLDQDAVPTIVEVKRSTDTRIRREVVGQMLDYAANAIVYWPADAIRAQFEATCQGRGADPEDVLTEFLGPDGDPGAFWQAAKHNLQTGTIRLVFVADHIPTELQRIVEFLDAQMDPAKVVAVEIKQFVGGSQTALVPRVVGQTAAARQAKRVGSTPSRIWNEESFFPELEQRVGIDEAQAARFLFGWCQTKGIAVRWSRGNLRGSFYAEVNNLDERIDPFSVDIGGYVRIHFGRLVTWPPFADEGQRRNLLHRLNNVPGIRLPPSTISRPYPGILLSALAGEAAMRQFLDVLDWLVEQLQESNA